MDRNFKLLGGGPRGSLGEWRSWLLGGLACALIAFGIVMARRRRQRYQFAVRPLAVEVAIGVIGCAVVLGAVWVANSYPWPPELATQYAERHGIVEPEGGLKIPTGVAYPVVILIGVASLMTYLARRRRFGRYVYAIGGNPEAAELSGVNVRRTIMMTFVLMGALCAISAAVQTARLNSAVTGLGTANELDVISAAVIGGTSFGGGIGTIPGAVLGAVVMQSLRSGMSLLGFELDDAGHLRRHRADRRRRSRLDAAQAVDMNTIDGRERADHAAPSDRTTAGASRSSRCATSAWRSVVSTPSTASASISTPARSSRWSAATAPASRR